MTDLVESVARALGMATDEALKTHGKFDTRQMALVAIQAYEAARWQPIDYDAPPADSVLVGGPGWTAEARWHTDPDGWWLANCDPTDAHDGQCYPTHWCPLPPAPEATRGDGK